MYRVKILDADGNVVRRLEAGDFETVQANIPEGGSYETIVSLQRFSIAVFDNVGKATEIIQNVFQDEIIGGQYQGQTIEIVDPSTVLEDINGPDFTRIRNTIRVSIDNEVGKKRGDFITIAPGQEYVYAAKAEEAQRYLADPTNGVFPYLRAIVPTGDMTSAATDIINAKQTADDALAQLDAMRVQYKSDLDGLPDDVAVLQSNLDQWMENIDNFTG